MYFKSSVFLIPFDNINISAYSISLSVVIRRAQKPTHTEAEMSKQPKTLGELTGRAINQRVELQDLNKLELPRNLISRLEETHMRDNCKFNCSVCRSAQPSRNMNK